MAENSENNITSNNSELFYEISQKENNDKKSFIGTKIYDSSNEIDNSGK